MTQKSLTSDTVAAGRPRRRRKEARPGEIIEAGLAEFGARGFEAARMEDVARRAGIAKGTVFRYFPTKETLFEAALTSRVGPMFEQLDAAIASASGPAMPLLERLVTNLYAQIGDPALSGLIRILIAEGPRFPAILAAHHRATISRGRALLERIVARGIASGEFQPGAIAALPMVLVGPAIMAAIWRITFGLIDPIPPELFMAAHLDLIRHGLQGVATGPHSAG